MRAIAYTALFLIVLDVAGKSTVLGSAISQPSDRAAIVQQINQFLGDPNQTELSARADDR
ncbi:MAG TPA: hypothetical protein IGQ16_00690 [Thermosynechococcus sp. M3746_W2019_013]|uniref:hypothetical protein n=1 Tax=Thermosynechococcus sp. M3746_W2019_013 TaxID=2747806 RepID=UPI0019E51A89|nr:hypothetical protein [Thermosynechococcus sp. M3746_W2019_013]HIK22172.1 hypothetical protein [Thermosynechococcus sp. M3746_W2019_013]